MAILEARFVNIAERSPVDVSKIPLPRFKLVSKKRWVCGCFLITLFLGLRVEGDSVYLLGPSFVHFLVLTQVRLLTKETHDQL